MARRGLSIVLAGALLALATMGGPAAAQTDHPERQGPLPPIDVSRDLASTRLAAEALVSASQRAAQQALEERLPGLQVRWNALTGTPARVQSTQRLLTERLEQPPAAAAVMRGFLQDNEALFGISPADLNTLVPVRQAAAAGARMLAEQAPTALTHVAFEQRWQGRQIYPTNMIGSVTGRGQLVSVAGVVAQDVGAKVNALEPELSALDAIAAAAQNLGADLDPGDHEPLGPPEGAEQRQSFSAGEVFDNQVPVRLIYFLASPDAIRLVWEVTAGLRQDRYAYQLLVDALTGEVLFRESITDEELPRWLSYVTVGTSPPVNARDDYQPQDSPRPLSPGPATPDGSQGSSVPPELVQTNGDPAQSVGGWIAPGVTTTTGNNVIAFVDLNLDGNADPGEQPAATVEDVDGTPTRTFDFPADFDAAPQTDANRRAATVNTFVIANWWHDRMAELGFTEEAGNFQQTNSTGTGVGGDPMLARLHVGTDNSTFATPAADGTCCPTLNSFTWTGPDPDRDSGFDAEVLIHEFTHGLSNRIIGGPNVRGLGGGGQAGGLGEGYSDIFALLLLRQPDEDPDGVYVVGGYAVFHLSPAFGQPPDWEENHHFGIRHFPYVTDLCRNPFTLVDMQTPTYDITPIPQAGCSATPPVSPWLATRSAGPHDMGEIWAVTVWEARRNLVGKHGAALGNELMLQLVTDSLFLLNRNPTFVEARDAILIAEFARTGGENRCELWRGFAKRGLGAGAETPVTGAFTEDFAVPEDCREQAVAGGGYSYAAKLVCGLQRDPEDFRLTQGRYATTVNIHNPGPETARFSKVLALTFPPEEQEPGEVMRIAEHQLRPEQALAADCEDIRRRLFPDGWPSPYVEGFLLIRSATSLDVAGVYTKAALDAGAGATAIDVEAVPERRLATDVPR